CQLHRACNETNCSFRMRRRMMWYAHRRRDPRSACPAVRGAVTASERTSTTTGAGDRLRVGGARGAGGGRKRATERDPELTATLLGLVEPDERGDPMSPLRW